MWAVGNRQGIPTRLPCPLDGFRFTFIENNAIPPVGLFTMTKNRFLFFGRFAVVAIFLFVVAFAIQNLWHVVKASEERTLNNAASEYEALEKMYPEKLQTLP